MSTLIKISNHLALILPGASPSFDVSLHLLTLRGLGPNDSPEQVVRNRELSNLVFPAGRVPKYGPAMLRPEFCGKWQVLETLLKEWRHDRSNKVLIFTKSVKLLEMLEFHLAERCTSTASLACSVRRDSHSSMFSVRVCQVRRVDEAVRS